MFWLLIGLVAASDYVWCDEEGHACKKGSTCCKTPSNDWACCPIEDAVCCGDEGNHCCPKGYPICDSRHGICSNHLGSYVGISTKEPALKAPTQGGLHYLVIGFIRGFGLELGFEEISECSTESLSSFYELWYSIAHFSGVTDFDKLISIEKLGKALIHLSRSMVMCEAASKQGLSKLEEFIERHKDPEKVIEEVVSNYIKRGNYITRELEQASISDSFDKGRHYGKAVAILFKENNPY